MVDLRNTIK